MQRCQCQIQPAVVAAVDMRHTPGHRAHTCSRELSVAAIDVSRAASSAFSFARRSFSARTARARAAVAAVLSASYESRIYTYTHGDDT